MSEQEVKPSSPPFLETTGGPPCSVVAFTEYLRCIAERGALSTMAQERNGIGALYLPVPVFEWSRQTQQASRALHAFLLREVKKPMTRAQMKELVIKSGLVNSTEARQLDSKLSYFQTNGAFKYCGGGIGPR